MVYHGTVTKRLGLDLAVRAFAKAATRCPGARCEIYGAGDIWDEREALTKSLWVEGRCTFSRKSFRIDALGAILQGAALGIIPNRRDVATEYMLPVKLLEYVYLGTPVIAPRLYAIQRYFKESEVAYYTPEDIDDFASTICRLYGSANERAWLKRNASAFYEKYSCAVQKEDLFRVIDVW